MWTDEYHEYKGGRCHTWSPDVGTKPGEVNSLLIQITIPEKSYYHGCDVYGDYRLEAEN